MYLSNRQVEQMERYLNKELPPDECTKFEKELGCNPNITEYFEIQSGVYAYFNTIRHIGEKEVLHQQWRSIDSGKASKRNKTGNFSPSQAPEVAKPQSQRMTNAEGIRMLLLYLLGIGALLAVLYWAL